MVSIHQRAHVEEKTADRQRHRWHEVVPRELRHSACECTGACNVGKQAMDRVRIGGLTRVEIEDTDAGGGEGKELSSP